MNNKKFITENIVLNAYGYTQNNKGYYDYSNSYFDEDIELKVGNSYHAMGFNIIIKEITNEFVKLEVLKSDYDVSKKDYVYKYDNEGKYLGKKDIPNAETLAEQLKNITWE